MWRCHVVTRVTPLRDQLNQPMTDLTPQEDFRPGLEKSNTLDAHQQVGVHF